MLSIHADTSHVIQLAVGPAFMLAAIGGTLTILSNRLARINDRTHKRREDRETADADSKSDEAKRQDIDTELDTLNRRARIINAAMTAGASCAIVVCLLIGSLFMANELEIDFDRPVALLFIVAMLTLIATYVLMLVEIFVAQHSINPT
ncbi:DUF2721 domain-containing protein [Xylophilus rhododendri]|uniref:DUF2721 domain-containing protein n=1 Tax=Xylophilus rhododendri TaxID=2697032 RepID=A0A857JB65_9BURK|nr:DUF2721 domain-containing protein [Xylophilus rhododendri]QHJ01261.1 DUF2721 domain-containing protein [Xylophilus rhododendri]